VRSRRGGNLLEPEVQKQLKIRKTFGRGGPRAYVHEKLRGGNRSTKILAEEGGASYVEQWGREEKKESLKFILLQRKVR